MPHSPKGRPRHHHVKQLDYPRRRHGDDAPLAVDWRAAPTVIICDHGHSDDVFMCDACAATLRRVVADIPVLMHDLEVAHSRQVSFLDMGTPEDANPHEAQLEFNMRASNAIAALRRAFDGDPVQASLRILADWPQVLRRPDLAVFAGKVSAAAKDGHHAIEHPPEMYDYGPCPECGKTIRQERITEGAQDQTVVCGECSKYAASLSDHKRTQLDRLENDMRTVAEILEAMRILGEPSKDRPLTRRQLDNMIYRDGLYREEQNRPRFTTDGRLVNDVVFTYRLRDVRALARRKHANGGG